METTSNSKVKINSTLISGRKDEALTYSRYVRNEETGESVAKELEDRIRKDQSFDTDNFKDGCVTTPKLANSSVTSEKIARGEVKEMNLDKSSVTTEKLADLSVTTQKIADKSITNDKVAKDAITIDKFDMELRKTLEAAVGLPEDLIESIQDVDRSIYSIEDTIYPMSVAMAATADLTNMGTELSYKVMWKGEGFTPDGITIHKTSSSGEEKTIAVADPSVEGSVTSPIEGNKEDFSITVTKEGKTSQGMTLPSRYLGYIGASGVDALTSEEMDSLGKVILHLDEDGGIKPTRKEVATSNYNYIWVVVPETLEARLVAGNGIPITLAEPQAVSNPLGKYNAYRSLNPLTEETWELVIS